MLKLRQLFQSKIIIYPINYNFSLPIIPFCSTSDGAIAAPVWVKSMAEGLQLAEKEQKPIMLFVHRSWCKACKNLVPIIKQNSAVRELNAKFVTVEMTGDDEATEENYAPDGAYVPRIVFLNSKGEAMKVTNPNNMTGTNLYTYTEANDLIAAMKKVIT